MKKILSNFGFIKSLQFLVRKISIFTKKVLSSCSKSFEFSVNVLKLTNLGVKGDLFDHFPIPGINLILKKLFRTLPILINN